MESSLNHQPSIDSHGPAAHWEERYSGADRVWSGKVNATTAAIITELDLRPGTAVDLGCGEGGDALWLAEHGWDVLGIDISSTATARAQAEALRRGVTAKFEVQDLETWQATSTFDLVTASFLHSTVALSRTDILRRAADAVALGGHLIVVSHLGFPAWSEAKDHDSHNTFLRPDQEIAELNLPSEEWAVVISQVRRRAATAPDGTPADLEDAIIVLQRH